jgi:hypothetical protein
MVNPQGASQVVPPLGPQLSLGKRNYVRKKMSSTGRPSARATFRASVADGVNTRFSMVLMVLRETPT